MNAQSLLAGNRVLPEERPSYQGKSCVVTGACGSLGSRLYEALEKDGASVLGLDVNEDEVSKGLLAGRNLLLCRARDVGSYATVNPDFIFHTAAYKHVDLGERFRQAFFFNNQMETQLLCQDTASWKAKIVLASTDKAAGQGVMGKSKWMSETYVRARGGVSIRLVNLVYSRGNVIDRWEGCLAKGEVPNVVPRGVYRFWMQPEDAVTAMLVGGKLENGTYAVTGAPEIEIRALYDAWAKDHEGGEPHEIPLRPGDQEREGLFNPVDEVLEPTGIPWLGRVIG